MLTRCTSLKQVFCLICYSLFSLVGIAQTYDFQNVGDQKKLQEKYIYDVGQLPDQRLILGTENGLTVFDGQKFVSKNFRENQDLNILNKVFVSSKGITFLGYFDGEVMQLKNGKVALRDNIAGKVVKFSENSKGEVHFLVQGKGVYNWSGDEVKKTIIKGVNDEEIFDFEFVQEGLIVGVENNLKFFDANLNLTGNLSALIDNTNPVSKPVIHKMPNSKKVLIIDETNSFTWLKLNSDGYFEHETTLNLSRIESRIEDVAFDDNNNLWLASKSSGLYKMEMFKGSVDSYSLKNFTKVNGLISNQLKSVYFDVKGILWIGYYGFGMSKLDNESIVLIDVIDGMKLTDVNALQANSQGELLIGTEVGLFRAAIGVKSKLTRIELGTTDVVVTCIAQTKPDEYWIGTRESGVYRLSKSGVVEKIDKVYNIKIDRVNNIEVNENGNVYVATDLGLYYYSAAKNSIQRITTNEGLVHNVLNDIYMSKDSILWFAPNGASLFSYKNGEYTVHKNIDNLNQYVLRTIIELKDGGICFGTETDGVFILRNDSVSQLSTKNGLLSNSVYSLIQEDKGTIWAFHKRGVTKFTPEIEVVQYLENDDLYDAEIGINSIYKDVTGVMWIGTNKGIIRFDKVIRQDTVSPTLVIESLVWNDQELSMIPEHSKYGNYSLGIQFLGVDLKKSDEIHYEYKLEGYDESWVKVGKGQNFVSYPKLKDGEYNFLIKAVNVSGKASEIQSFKFMIDIPFWKSWWFIISAPAVLILIIFGLFQWRFSRIKRQKIVLENTVRKRTNELRKEKDNLNEAKVLIEHKNKEITDSINYAERIQKAMLPVVNQSNLSVSDMFVFFSPCDIVSGDFYWLGNKGGLSIAVVADCTGHGVPGAFMSMISSTLLDKIILDNGVVQPEEIVRMLDLSISDSLKSKESKTKDGIDIGVMVIDESQQKLTYCGASRPLFQYRNGELEVYKGGMLSIGEFIEEIPKEYVRHEISYLKGDQFYLSSDGFPDQFGGPRDRKYMVGKFKKFLRQLSELPFEKQAGVMKNEFERWKGPNHQTDDVLVIGIKM